MATHYLIAKDTDKCIAQAHFIVKDKTVRVVALIGATQYIDRDMTCEEARAEYRRLKGYGWVVPTVKPLTTYALRYHIYD